MTPKDAQERLRILKFWERHGLSATQEAFGVSRRTLYRWKAALKAAGDNPAALIPKPPIAKRKRGKNRDPRLVKRIRELRTLYPNLGKERLHRLLAPWCAEHGITLPSVSTIGRIIAEAPDKMRLVPKRLDARGRSKTLRPRVRKTRKPKGLKVPPMTLWALDTIERVRDGVRRYILTLVDPVSRCAFALALPKKSSRVVAEAFQALASGQEGNGQPLQLAALSDNGSEFQGAFDAMPESMGLTHYWTYPKSPRMNAHCERFNRTIQEQFVDWHEELLFTDLELFNQKLSQWLIDYNTVLPHHSLDLKAPVQWLLENHKECQRYWTNTPRLDARAG